MKMINEEKTGNGPVEKKARSLFDLVRMLGDPQADRGMDVRTFLQKGRRRTTMMALSFAIAGSPVVDRAALEEIEAEITEKFTVAQADDDVPPHHHIVRIVELSRKSIDGNTICVKIVYDKGSDLPCCDKTLRTIWIYEKRSGDYDCDPVVDDGRGFFGHILKAVARVFGIAA